MEGKHREELSAGSPGSHGTVVRRVARRPSIPVLGMPRRPGVAVRAPLDESRRCWKRLRASADVDRRCCPVHRPAVGCAFHPHIGITDDRAMPTTVESRRVGDTERDMFPAQPTAAMNIVIPDGIAADRLTRYAAEFVAASARGDGHLAFGAFCQRAPSRWHAGGPSRGNASDCAFQCGPVQHRRRQVAAADSTRAGPEHRNGRWPPSSGPC